MKKLIALLLTCLSLTAQSLPPQQPPDDPFFGYNGGSNYLLFDGGGYYSDGYQWPWRNTGQAIQIFDVATGTLQSQLAEPAGTASANIFDAWRFQTDASNIKIALIDYGFDTASADLEGRWLPGVRVYDGVITENYSVANGSHGTQAAGIIGAIGNNGAGIAGVCKGGATLLPIEVLGRNADDFAVAINYAVAHGVKIIYFPWGWPYEVPSWQLAIVTAREAGVLIVCAAAQGYPTPTHDYPAEWVSLYDNLLLVGGHDMAGQHWPDSGWQHNGYIHLLAPGRRVPALWPGSTTPRYTSGTSSASAFAVGAAALVWSAYPNMSYLEVKTALMSTLSDGERLNLNAAMILVRQQQHEPPQYFTTVELTWTALPGEEFGVWFWPEAAGPPFSSYWHGVGGPISGNTFQYTHESPQGCFRVVKYNYEDEWGNPPAEWFTPVNIDSIRFVSKVEIVP